MIHISPDVDLAQLSREAASAHPRLKPTAATALVQATQEKVRKVFPNEVKDSEGRTWYLGDWT